MSEPKPLVQRTIHAPATPWQSRAEEVCQLAEALIVDGPEMAQVAIAERESMKAMLKEMETERLSLTRPLDADKKLIMDFYRGPLTYLERAVSAIDKSLLAYQHAAEQKRLADQRIADAAAAKLREEAAAAARELAERAQEAAKLAERAATAADRQHLEQQAAQAAVEAEAMSMQAATISAPVVAAAAPAGASFPKRWVATVENKLKLLEFVLANPSWSHLVEVSEVELNKAAVSLKDSFNTVFAEAGVKASQKAHVRSGR